MITRHDHYEIFISYAREDNAPIPASAGKGWVTALRDHILEDHRRFSTEPLRIFMDNEVRSIDDWQHRILGALRHSKILLVCLSPNYLASTYCRWEWDEYRRRQVDQLIGADSIATIYFIETPDADEQKNARWFRSVTQGNYIDIRPWYPEGPEALERDEVRKRMAELGESLWERIRLARRAIGVPGNIRRMNEYFVGRNEELRQLHENLATGAIGLVTAVHGLGGQGKTELAVAYAHGWAHCYPAGLWALGAEGKKEMLPLIGELANDPQFDFQPTDAERKDPAMLGRAVLAELERRAAKLRQENPDAPASALILLDNVSEAELLSPVELAMLPRANWLRMIATTRLGRGPLHESEKSLAFVAVDSLDEANALALIRDHQPGQRFNSPAEEAAAREIVHDLGGFTLAVEQVAVHLGLNPEIAPAAFLAGLRRKGLVSADSLGARPDVRSVMLHQQKQLAVILETTVSRLDPPALTALKFAALLPPDCVPWPWLKALVTGRHPDLARFDPDEPDPWFETRRRITGLRLLTDGDDPAIARIHRLVAAHLQKHDIGGKPADESLESELEDLVAKRAWAIYNTQSTPDFWELDALLLTLPAMLATAGASHDLVNAAIVFTDKVKIYRDLPAAKQLLLAAHLLLRQHAASDGSNTGRQRDLSVSQIKIGDVLIAQGDLEGALSAYREGLAVMQTLAARDGSNTGWQRDLSVSQNKIGNVLLAQGDLAGGLSAYREALAVRQTLAAGDGSNTEWQRDLSVSHEKIGNVLLAQGDLAGALSAYRESLAVMQTLAAGDGSNTEWQWDLSVSQSKIGDVLRTQGDLAGALSAYREALAVMQTLAAMDGSNTEWQRDLSVSQSKIGDVLRTQGDLAGASGAYQEDLRITERLAAADRSNAGWQRDLFVSYWRMADMAERSGTGDAMEWLRKAYEQLSGMKQRGVMLPTDEKHLARLKEKVKG